jgi:hypothetical protein
VVFSCSESTGTSNFCFSRENVPSQFYSTLKKRSCLYFLWGKKLSCSKFLKEFLRVVCFFGKKPWHFICLRTEADDFLFSFRGERTVSFMIYGYEMSWFFRVASLMERRICVFLERIFHRNFIVHESRSCLYFLLRTLLSSFKFLKEFLRVFCFFGHKPWHFICLRIEADDFLFSLWGVMTVGFMFYGDEMSWYFSVSCLRYSRILVFLDRIFHRNFILRVKNCRVYIFVS